MLRVITNSSFKTWLLEHGKVFKTSDKHDSGNISYGVITAENKKHFIKFAAFTNKQACEFLLNACKIAKEVQHPILTKFNYYVECSDGIAVVYDWTEAESINEVTIVSKLNSKLTREHPHSPYSRLKALPVPKILSILNKIIHLHLKIEEAGYISSDWYDGCLMYDFSHDLLYIMDLDIYHKGSFTNTMGRMLGSSRFMAPEEFELNAIIDVRTMVYHMGATVFELLGKGKKKLQEGFRGNKEQFLIALKAISKNKENRYQSVREFYFDWIEALEY